MTDQSTVAVSPGPGAERLRQAVADVESALERATLNGDAALRREVYVRLLEDRLANGPSVKSEFENGDWSDDQRLDGELATEMQRARAIAECLDVPAARVGELFDLSSRAPRLNIPGDWLPDSNAAAVPVIALLTSAGRHAAQLETGTADIHKAAEQYGKWDGDFIAHLERERGVELQGNPRSRNRRVQLLFGGIEQAGRLARELLAK